MDHDAKIRPLYIAKLLAEFTDEEHYLTTVQIQQLLKKRYGMDAYRRTIPGDIQILKEFGLDIQETRSTQNRYNLLSRTFDTAELKLLIDAVLSARFISKKRSEELAAKLAGLESTVKGRQLTRHVSVENRVKSGNEKIYLIIDAVNEAIRTGRKISFRYFRFNEAKEPVLRHGGAPFTFSPHRLVWNGDFYYMLGAFEESGDVGIFRVDRIVGRPDILDDPALPMPADFDLETFLTASFRMYGNGHTRVQLVCTNDVMDALLDKFGRDVETRPAEEGHFLANVDVAVSHVFYSWVFGFGGKVRIAGPEEVREGYREMVKRAGEA